jgi:formylglycine-generating enzyme required for sulfatase activity
MTRTRLVSLLAATMTIVLVLQSTGRGALGQTRPGETPTKPTPKTAKPAPKKIPARRGTGNARPTTDNAADERAFWESIKDSKNPADFRAYLRKYGEKGKFSDLAQNRLTEIEAANKPGETKPPATAGTSGGSSTSQPTTQPAKPAAGTPWRSPQEIDFVYVPSGSFDMGSPQNEKWRTDDELQHPVTISGGFYLGKYEVTQSQWKAAMDSNPSSHQGEDLPVENVSWDDVQEFIRRLNTQSGGAVYRLPTEAEWEYAARAGTTGPYPGNLDATAWHVANSANQTHPVGQKQPNAWGLYDMLGNVWEWCQDRYEAFGDGAQVDPVGPSSGSYRVIRGGSVTFPIEQLRLADRGNNVAPGYRDRYLGLRLVRIANTNNSGAIPNSSFNVPKIQPRAGTTWRSPQGIDFVYIPAGSFEMGSSDGPANERPKHHVTISKGFYLGKFEITQAQWRAIMGTDPSTVRNDDLPVGKVSWEDVQEFIRQLNAKGEASYRLPTEAEWEYACRAGTEGPFAGDVDALGWYAVNSGRDAMLPVGKKQPNAWGLYDMHGNVWEWVEDWFGEDYYATSPSIDPTGPTSGRSRLFRGGSTIDQANDLRSAKRNYDQPSRRSFDLGFRLLRVL